MNYETYEVRVFENGDKLWYQNGERHRLDGPAIEYANGTKHWRQNDKLHRLDGPAIEWSDGSKEYFIEGIEYTYEEWKQKVEELNNPVKEMTVGEVSEKLGFEVKIVKESNR